VIRVGLSDQRLTLIRLESLNTMVKDTIHKVQTDMYCDIATILPLCDADEGNYSEDMANPKGILDGSVSALKSLLRDLLVMVEPDTDPSLEPVLELRFGDVVTRTSLLSDAHAPYLSIIALKSNVDDGLSFQSMAKDLLSPPTSVEEDNILWHAEHGQYVTHRKITIFYLKTESDVMDAIADTAKEAELWFSAMHSGISQSRGTTLHRC